MSDAQKVKVLAEALREVNKKMYAKGAPLGSTNYFDIRCITVEALKATGELPP
jgi:hypothetical protein